MWAGGKLGAIWQPAEFLIIIGAAAGSLIIGNPPHVLKEMRQQVPATIKGPTEEYEYYMELMALLNNLLETARSRGFKFFGFSHRSTRTKLYLPDVPASF